MGEQNNERQYKDNRTYRKNKNGKRLVGLACASKEDRVRIAKMGGYAVSRDKDALRERGRKAGLVILKTYGLKHFAKMGKKGGRIGGVRGGVTRRAKRDARLLLLQQQRKQQEQQQQKEEQQAAALNRIIQNKQNQDEGN